MKERVSQAVPQRRNRALKLFLATILAVGMIPMIPSPARTSLSSQAYAANEEFQWGDFAYTVNENDNATIVRYLGNGGDVEIPATIEGHPVKELDQNLFRDNQSIDNVKIAEGVFFSGSMLFAYSSIKTINMPSTWVNYHMYMFAGCDKLTAINVSESNLVFSSIDGVLYSKDETELLCYPGGKEEEAFTVPFNVTTIYDSAFSSTVNLKSIKLGDSVAYLDYASLSGASIETVEMGTGLNSLSGGAFGVGLVNVVANSNSNFIVENGVVYDKTRSEILVYPGNKVGDEFTIPSNVKTIGDGAFSKVVNLKTLIIPNSIEVIDSYEAFRGLSLKTIEIGSNVKSINIDAIPFGPGLEEIIVDPSNTCFSSQEGVLYNYDQTELLAYPANKTGQSFTAPISVESVGPKAFTDCNSIEKLTFPSMISDINRDAFWLMQQHGQGFVRIVFKGGISDSFLAKNEPVNTYFDIVIGDDSVRRAFSSGYFINSDLSQIAFELVETNNTNYVGASVTPNIRFTKPELNSFLVKDEDYAVKYENNINAGQAKVVVEGIGDFTGSSSVAFIIEPANIKDATITLPDTVVYADAPCAPKPIVTWNDMTLEEDTDYTLSYVNNDSPHTLGTVIVMGMGNFEGEYRQVFKIKYDEGDGPETPDTPDVPDTPVTPPTPVDPDTPDTPDVPEEPTIPDAPDTPTEPENPDTPEEPTDPEAPEVPDEPTEPVVPDTPDTPSEPDTPTKPTDPIVPTEPETPSTGWVETDTGWQYKDENGALAANSWQKINGKWYHFDDTGYMQTGWVKDNSTWYYLNKAGEGTEGAMAKGWKQVDNTWYYLDNSGAMQTGWQNINGAWYHLNTSGAMTTGWIKDNNVWYYCNKSGEGTEGKMAVGWKEVDDTWYYFNASGAMQTGWQFINGSWYLLNNFGAMQTGWQKVNGFWYYLSASGAMQTGWQQIDGVWYYLNLADGAMAANTWIGNYYVDASGKWVSSR